MPWHRVSSETSAGTASSRSSPKPETAIIRPVTFVPTIALQSAPRARSGDTGPGSKNATASLVIEVEVAKVTDPRTVGAVGNILEDSFSLKNGEQFLPVSSIPDFDLASKRKFRFG